MSMDWSDLPDLGDGALTQVKGNLEQHLAEEAERLEKDPMTHGLPPHEAQRKVHSSLAGHIMWVAANRVGKSSCGIRECLWRARGDHPYKPDLKPHNFIVIGIPDFTFFRETTEPIMLKWLPKGWVVDENRSEKWWKIRRVDGGVCTIQVKTFDQGRRSWQGFSADFIWLDEEHPEDVYREAFARVITSRGTMLQTFTPVGGLGWTYDRIYLPAKKGKKDVDIIEAALAEYDDTCECGHGPDVHTHGDGTECGLCDCKYFEMAHPYAVGRILVPHMRREDVLRFAGEYPDEDERAIRVFGQYRARTGTIFKMVRREIHEIDPFPIPAHWPIWGGVDPGFNGFAASFYAQDPQGRTYAIAEMFSQHEPTATRFERMAHIYRRLRPTLPAVEPHPAEQAYATLRTGPVKEDDWYGVDVCAMFVDTEDPQTILELNLKANESGAPFVFVQLENPLKSLKGERSGILRLQQLFQPEIGRKPPPGVERTEEHAKKVGEPSFYFFNNLLSTWRDGDELIENQSRLMWEIERYTWKKPPRNKKVAPDQPDKESAGGAHMIDTTRYAAMARLGPPEEPEKDPYPHLKGWEREVWEHMQDLETQMLEDTGLI